MKILLVSLYLPQKKSKHAGGRYVYEILTDLSKKHEVYLATRIQTHELPQLETLRPLCKTIFTYIYKTTSKRNLLDNLKLIINYLGFSRYADQLIGNGSYDLVQVEWVETALLINKAKIPMILDAHDVITKPAERMMNSCRGFGRLFAGLKYFIIKTAELRIMKRFDIIITLSEYDKKYLLQLMPDLSVKTVPIPAGLDISSERSYEPQKHTILFLASFKYRKVNVAAALYFYRYVFPRISEQVPEARFIIAGYGPPQELKALADENPRVEVLGFVEDIDRCYKEAEVFVAPILTGGGIIVKILDALAAGVPVVTTSYGNEGIGAMPGKELLVGNDPDSMAAGVIKLLQDKNFANFIGANGRAFVQSHYNLDAIIRKREEIFRELKTGLENRP